MVDIYRRYYYNIDTKVTLVQTNKTQWELLCCASNQEKKAKSAKRITYVAASTNDQGPSTLEKGRTFPTLAQEHWHKLSKGYDDILAIVPLVDGILFGV